MLGQPVCTAKGKRRGRHFSAWCRFFRGPTIGAIGPARRLRAISTPMTIPDPGLSGHEFGALKAHALQRS